MVFNKHSNDYHHLSVNEIVEKSFEMIFNIKSINTMFLLLQMKSSLKIIQKKKLNLKSKNEFQSHISMQTQMRLR